MGPSIHGARERTEPDEELTPSTIISPEGKSMTARMRSGAPDLVEDSATGSLTAAPHRAMWALTKKVPPRLIGA